MNPILALEPALGKLLRGDAYLRGMAGNFSTTITFEGKSHLAVIVPSLRRNGMHYEINITGFPRFWMHWGAMDRYEVVRPADIRLPDNLVLAVSDAIERQRG